MRNGKLCDIIQARLYLKGKNMDYKEYFEAQRSSCRLPRWEDLPDIELYMDQVITLMSKYFGKFSSKDETLLTPSMINNYVKNSIIPAPVKKKYSRTHLFRLIIICVMKQILPINDIGALIETLLKTRSEAEVLNLFTEQYEEEFLKTMDVLEKNTANRAGEPKEALLSFSVMHAAAIAGGSRFYAEFALDELKKTLAPAEEAPEEQKKTAKNPKSAKTTKKPQPKNS